MSYSHYLPEDEAFSYRYNAVTRRPVSPGFNERTSNLLNSNHSAKTHYTREDYLRTPYHTRQHAFSRETTPFQTADYIPTGKYDPSSNIRRSGHFYMTANTHDDKYDHDYQRDNKVT